LERWEADGTRARHEANELIVRRTTTGETVFV